jgi:hypothetical protein
LEYATECGNHEQADLKLIDGFLNTCCQLILSLPRWRSGWRRQRLDILRRKCPLTTPQGLISPRQLAFFCYKPGFLKLQVKQGGGNGEWRDRGNCLSFVREVRLGMTGPSRELGKMVEARLEENGDLVDREKERMETFDKGVSVEAKYAFT